MRISVITVCYNSVKTIERTIKSVISQNYPHVEYIVIDGGSIDGTVEIIKQYERSISYWVSEKDYGIYDAMNKGLIHATGDIIAFLNSDDWYEEGVFDIVAYYFREKKIQILCGDIYFHRNGLKSRKHINKKEVENEIRVRMGYYHTAMFVRRDLFERYGMFDTRYKIVADYDWLLRVYDGHETIAVIDEVFSNFCSGGISSQYDMLNQHLQERKKVSMLALQRNRELTEEEKQKWRNIIEDKCIEDRYYPAYLKILEDIIADKDKMILVYAKQAFDKESYAVFGAGSIYNELRIILNKMDICITAVLDNDESRWGQMVDGDVICDPNDIGNRKDMIIVASTIYEREIEEQLTGQGLKKNIDYLLYSELRKKIVDFVETGRAQV